MGAFHRSSADVQGRANNLVHAQRLRAHGRASDVHNGVNRAYFMKVDLLYIGIVDLGFRRSQCFENPDGLRFGGFADRRFVDHLPDLLQAAMMVLMGMARLVLLMAMRMAL